MKKEILINVLQPEETRIAILENGILEELYVERVSHESYVGNIYKGKIVNIEPSIQAAFIDFGVGRNGFLHISDVDPFYFNGGNGIDALIEASQGAVSAPRSRRTEFDDDEEVDVDEGPDARRSEPEPERERERERRPRRGERSDSRRRPDGRGPREENREGRGPREENREGRGSRDEGRDDRGRRDEERIPEAREGDEHHGDERGPADSEAVVDRGEGDRGDGGRGESSSRSRSDREDRDGERGGRRRGRRGRGRRKRESAVDTDIPTELTTGGRELPDLEDFDIEASPELPPVDEPKKFRASEEPPPVRREVVREEPTFAEPVAEEPAPEPPAPVPEVEEEDSFGLGILEDETNGSGSGGANGHDENSPLRRQPGVHRRTSPSDDDDEGGFGSGIFGDEPEIVSKLEPVRPEIEEPRRRDYEEDRHVEEAHEEGPEPRVERFDRDDHDDDSGPTERDSGEVAAGGDEGVPRDRGPRSSEEGEDSRPRRRRRRGGRGRRGRRDNEEGGGEPKAEGAVDEEESLSFDSEEDELAPPAARDERPESRGRRDSRRNEPRDVIESREADLDDRHDSDFGDNVDDVEDNVGNRVDDAPVVEPRRPSGDRERGGRSRGGRDRGDRGERGGRDRGRDDRDSEGGDRRPAPRGERGDRRGRPGGDRRPGGGMRGSNARRPRQRPPIQEIFRRGQEVLVQVIKEGIGNKGPTLSTYISIPGRYLVLMPGLNRVGVSRKIVDEDQRRKLRDLVAQLDRPNGVGFIIRTAGLERSQTDLERDMSYLLRLWDVVLRRIKNLKGPNVIYQESDMIIRTIRDIFSADIDTIYIDEPNAYERAKEFLQLIMPKYVDRLKLYDKPEPLFHNFGIEQEITRIQERTVPLARGGSIVVDQTEALVAIDVNSGNFRADDNAEETAFQMNLAAAKEIARQLRLRDLGGVIVNDFIDMKEERHRRDVENALRDAVRRDRARTKILRMSAFGLIEMTRQRIRPSLKRSLYRECSVCHGTGQTKTVESMSIDCMRMLTHVGQRKEVRRIQLTVHNEIAEYLLNHKRPELIAIEHRGEIALKILGQPMKSAEDFELLCYDEDGDLLQVGPPIPHHGGGRR